MLGDASDRLCNPQVPSDCFVVVGSEDFWSVVFGYAFLPLLFHGCLFEIKDAK